MSESTVGRAQSTAGSAHKSAWGGAGDLRMLAQVEKWMAMIREISREQPAFQR
jgi:hypothetical protein